MEISAGCLSQPAPRPAGICFQAAACGGLGPPSGTSARPGGAASAGFPDFRFRPRTGRLLYLRAAQNTAGNRRRRRQPRGWSRAVPETLRVARRRVTSGAASPAPSQPALGGSAQAPSGSGGRGGVFALLKSAHAPARPGPAARCTDTRGRLRLPAPCHRVSPRRRNRTDAL